ncbi:MAG: hypothetical protein MI923_29925 [Phycisphaerales bacterium]|nr:hypothetical protein [Phycisphaerales bacterium]
MGDFDQIEAAISEYEHSMHEAQWRFLNSSDDCSEYSELVRMARCERAPTSEEALHFQSCLSCRTRIAVLACGKPVVGHPKLKEENWKAAYARQVTWSDFVEQIRQEAQELQSAYLPKPPRRTVRFKQVALAATIAAAALVAIFILPFHRALIIEEFNVTTAAVRGEKDTLNIDLTLNRTAYITIIMVDERFERWIKPFDTDTSEFVQKTDRMTSLSTSIYPNPDDVRGPAKAIMVMAIASLDPILSVDELLDAIPDPVVPPDADRQAAYARLKELGRELEGRLECLIRVELIPAQ